ncbi:hypothetical protein R6Q59_016520 [Mikania micrantha]
MRTDTYMYLLDEYLKSQDLERGALFGSSEFLVNVISSKDYALKIAKLIRDPDTVLTAIGGTVLTAIAHNFPPELNILERRMMLLFSHIPVTFKFVEAIHQKAEAYKDAIWLLRFTCGYITTSTTCNNAIFEATRQNAVEFVKIIVSRFPNAIWSKNRNGHTIIKSIYETSEFGGKNNWDHRLKMMGGKLIHTCFYCHMRIVIISEDVAH